MKQICRRVALGTALALCATTALPLMALPVTAIQDHDDHDRDRDRDRYVQNSYYRTGNREGYEDYQRKVQRKRHHHTFRTDDDRRAHDYGYQEGWQGRQYRDHDDPH